MSGGRHLVVNDIYAPARGDSIEVVEVKSSNKPRCYVLVSPENTNVECLDVRDHFLWERLDGERTLAVLKQDYYAKFKALPTAHITELVHRWLRQGFLSDRPDEISLQGGSKPSPFVLRKSFSALPARRLLGVLFIHFSTLPAVVAVIALSLSGYGFSMWKGGLESFSAAFSGAVPMSRSVLGIIACFYVFALVRLLLRLGLLARSPCYKWDLLYAGLAGPVPFLRASTRGFLLKNWETRLMNHLVVLLFPAFLGAVAFAFVQAQEAGGSLRPGLEILGMAGLLDIIFQTCPFWNSSLNRIQSDLVGPTVSIGNLAGQYLRDLKLHLRERPRDESRQVMLHFGVIFAWVIMGSSILLMTTSTVVEGLLNEWRTVVEGRPMMQQALRISLFAPMFLAFLFLFWKMIQPLARSVVENERWNDRVLQSAIMCLFGIAAAFLLFVLPLAPALAAFAAYAAFSVAEAWRGFSSRSLLLKLHWGMLGVSAAAALLAVLFPGLRLLCLVPAACWLLWYFFAFRSLAPSSAKWLVSALAAAICLAIPVGIVPLIFGEGLSPVLAFALPAAAALSLFIFTSGGCGVHFAQGTLGCLMLMVGADHLGKFNTGEPLILAGLIFLDLQGRGLAFTLGRRVAECFLHLSPDGADARARMEESLHGFASAALGKWSAEAHRAALPKDFRFIRSYENWMRKWLSADEIGEVMGMAVASLPWEERSQWEARLQLRTPENLESRSGLPANKRLALLQSQLFFKRLDPEIMKDLAERLVPVLYCKEDVVVLQGSKGHSYLEIVARGRAIMSSAGMNGEGDTFLAELGPGDAVRGRDLFRQSPYPFSVKAAAELLCVRLHHKDFSSWCMRHKQALSVISEATTLSEAISGLSLFRDFSAEKMRVLMGRLARREAVDGEEIIRQGDEGDDFYLLHEGEVEVLVDGRKVAVLKPGSYFGEIALLQKCTRTATVRSKARSVLYSLGQREFEHFFAQGRGAQVLLNVSSKRVEDNRAL